jgi:hypothetical protein
MRVLPPKLEYLARKTLSGACVNAQPPHLPALPCPILRDLCLLLIVSQTNYKRLTTAVAHMWYRRRLLRKTHGQSDSEEEEDDQNGGSSRSVKFGGPKVPVLRASGSKILHMQLPARKHACVSSCSITLAHVACAHTPGFQMSSTLRAHPVGTPGNSSADLSVGGFTRASDLVRSGGVDKGKGWAKGAKGVGSGSEGSKGLDGFSSRALAEIHKRSVGARNGFGGVSQVMTLKSTFVNGSPVPPAMAAAARVQAAAQETARRAEGIALKTNSW